jgi:hypothetical protein
MASTSRTQEQRHKVVSWSNEQQILRDHIRNGVCRELYSETTALMALRYLEDVLETETNTLLDHIREV